MVFAASKLTQYLQMPMAQMPMARVGKARVVEFHRDHGQFHPP
jgi:hypothetical protein